MQYKILQVLNDRHFRLSINIFMQHRRPHIHICLDTSCTTIIVPSMLLSYRAVFKQINKYSSANKFSLMAYITFTYVSKMVENSSANKCHLPPYGTCQIIHFSDYLQYNTSLQHSNVHSVILI